MHTNNVKRITIIFKNKSNSKKKKKMILFDIHTNYYKA